MCLAMHPHLKTVIKLAGDMVIALDIKNQQSAAHQGYYKDVRHKILRDSSEKTKFYQEDLAGNLVRVSQKEWGRK